MEEGGKEGEGKGKGGREEERGDLLQGQLLNQTALDRGQTDHITILASPNP